MNASSIAVLIVLIALSAAAVWRNLKKGAPCECGGSCKDCDCGCGGDGKSSSCCG